jgi:uncharacterized protein
VTNVTNFGAFVDIGVHQDGLVHISQLSNKYIKDPREVVSPGDHVKVRVLEVNFEKNQISLSIKAAQEATRPSGRPERTERAERGRDRHANGDRHAKGDRPARGEREERGARGRAPAPAPTPSGGKSPVRPAKPPQVFNNAFAGLAALKGQLKK